MKKFTFRNVVAENKFFYTSAKKFLLHFKILKVEILIYSDWSDVYKITVECFICLMREFW